MSNLILSFLFCLTDPFIDDRMIMMMGLKGGEHMNNLAIRQAAKAARLPLWMIADAMKISEPTMTRKLRRELAEPEKERILAIIRDLTKTS